MKDSMMSELLRMSRRILTQVQEPTKEEIINDWLNYIESRYSKYEPKFMVHNRQVGVMVKTPSISFGKSTCSPNDKFDVRIGQAIAFARAINATIPDEIYEG